MTEIEEAFASLSVLKRGEGISVAEEMFKAIAIAGRFYGRFATTSSSSSIHATNIVLRAIPPSTPNLKVIEVEFDSGEKYIYSAEFLRVRSPAGDSQRRSAKG